MRPYKVFPIKTETACQLKWVWSTVYLSKGETASCHRTNHHKFDLDTFNFHNTSEKIQDRKQMLQGQWPERGCEYCRNIEDAGGASDRITNLDLWTFDQPKELQQDPEALQVTPRLLEIYFNNKCNLKCTYCTPQFSSLWDKENRQFGGPLHDMPTNYETNKTKMFNWFKENIDELHQLNVLGGEPLYQEEFDQLLDVLEQTPAPNLTITFFSNLAVAKDKLVSKINRIEKLKQQGKVKDLMITCSLDCWGPEQEYARFPLDLTRWEKNFNYLLDKEWITLVIGSTITPLTIKTLDQLFEKINEWNKVRPVYWYGNSVNSPSHMFIDMFGDVFKDDFDRALALMPTESPEQQQVKRYLQGIRDQSISQKPNLIKIKKLYEFLEKMDFRRNISWRKTYPYLLELFNKHNIEEA